MKGIFLFYYAIVQMSAVTPLPGANEYVGCFIDRIGERDLGVFIGDYEHLTVERCSLACAAQNLLYAAIQYGTECRCGQHYGGYGQVSDEECTYLCSSTDRCGGDRRNSVYRVKQSDSVGLGPSCESTSADYAGCFANGTLTVMMGAVKSVEACATRCAGRYPYAGIRNG